MAEPVHVDMPLVSTPATSQPVALAPSSNWRHTSNLPQSDYDLEQELDNDDGVSIPSTEDDPVSMAMRAAVNYARDEEAGDDDDDEEDEIILFPQRSSGERIVVDSFVSIPHGIRC